MINVTRLNGSKFVLNSDLIETMEETPDTVITITGGNKYVVAEPIKELINLIIQFRKHCHPVYTERKEEEGNEPEKDFN